MEVKCDIDIEYNDEKKTKIIMKSIEVDNLKYVKTEVNGKHLKTHIESQSISSLIHTLDDYLACISIAENVIDKK